MLLPCRLFFPYALQAFLSLKLALLKKYAIIFFVHAEVMEWQT